MLIEIIGGGLAGCEAAFQAARSGARVSLYEMKPKAYSPAHVSPDLGELVCSNSLRSNSLANAVGLLKEEMRRMDSLIMAAAEETRVPAGDALAVDRRAFSARVTSRILALENVTVIREEVKTIPRRGISVVASGPLTSPALTEDIRAVTGSDHLYFYDAIAPIVDGDSLDRDIVFRASRYGEGNDYLNCPMTSDEYHRFVDELNRAEKVPYRDFEEPVHFEGCLPVEEMAERGSETLAHGPMKPVGLVDPRTGRTPYAVVQLRHEDPEGRAYNLVGFQTKLKWKEQEWVFRTLPGLGNAVFLRFGSLHRNTYIHSPALLEKTLQLRSDPRVLFAGQITGVEGYVESTATGLLAGVNAARLLRGRPPVAPPATTALGSLVRYVSNPEVKEFQPMNVNFGLFPPLGKKVRGRDKKKEISRRALDDLDGWREQELKNEVTRPA
ncbi:MAG TPA: methylenetetrahydrofolate--tRNA-(uracil(54)-C(5))-methyltransferase (FADH(2)-oxidizing) TrmFO [Thermodesulfobacteriota bacterium]|nr:methylenetetrahydrofolate--tRNA-(uracil(54)-C(5))-methyltransferase (FADH(2)-oxidizing) TrmFO [Thermodesulfobacteriota bacterium]